jgi:prevent-host-death family protein
MRSEAPLDAHRNPHYIRTEFDARREPAMNITKDISPLTEFKRDSARLIAQIKETGRPQILTVNGKPSVVVMDAAAWQEMQDRLDHADTVAGIRKGLMQARSGEGIAAGQFFDGLARTK